MRLLTEEAETLAPSMFVVPRYMAFTSWAAEATQTLDHELGVRQLTGVCITTLPAGYPRLDGVLADTSVLIERGDAPLMEIILDNGRQEKRRDLRPVLPLVLSY